MMSAIHRIARGVFFARGPAVAREAAPERSQFDHDSFEHVQGLHLPADRCGRSASPGPDGEAEGRREAGGASRPAPAGARHVHPVAIRR